MNTPPGHRTIQTASHWGVYNVEIDPRGQIVRTTPFKADPHPSSYVASLPETVRSPLRITQPHVRAGYLQREKTRKRGGEPFVPVGWDEALDLVAGELARVKSRFGNEAIYGGSYG